MSDTNALIDQLSTGIAPVKRLPGPTALFLKTGGLLLLYAAFALFCLEPRADLGAQMGRFSYVAEIALLVGVMLSSLRAAVTLVYPDQYQYRGAARWPFFALALFVAFLGMQAVLPPEAGRALGEVHHYTGRMHTVECALCISAVAMLPAALLFRLLRQGASVRPVLAGSYAALAAASMSTLTLRITEANDTLSHLVVWHYLPVLLFSVCGAVVGKWLLRW